MSTILITGGTGLTGKALTHELLKKGYNVIILTRKIPERAPEKNLSYALWDINEQTIDVEAVQQAEYIVHLAGAGVVEKKWTAAYKKEIVDSRTKSSCLLVDTLKKYPNDIKAVISASAIGWYGEDPLQISPSWGGFGENDKPDSSFLGTTCKLWEESIEPVTQSGKRLVKFRMGIVLSKDGGAFVEFTKPLRYGIAAILGNGKQIVSWIHITDMVNLFIAAIENRSMNGVYNAVAPIPVSNKKLTLSLAAAMGSKFFIPVHVPSSILKLILEQRSIEVLKSTTVSCKKIQGTGFSFQFDNIETALKDLTKKYP